MTKKTVLNAVYIVSGVMAIAGVFMQIGEKEFAYAVFGVGALGMAIAKALSVKRSDDFRMRRLQNIEAIGALLLLFTAYLMYINSNIWALTLVLATIFDLIVVYRTPKSKD